jgi:hypothetical protein
MRRMSMLLPVPEIETVRAAGRESVTARAIRESSAALTHSGATPAVAKATVAVSRKPSDAQRRHLIACSASTASCFMIKPL